MIASLNALAAQTDFMIGNSLSQDNFPKALAAYPELVKGLWPPLFQMLEKLGVYVIKFFKNGRWRYVMVDDRLPASKEMGLIYAKSSNASNLWVSLIEKAYAKLHRCYQALNSGYVNEIMTDFTGMDTLQMKLSRFIFDPEVC